MPETTQYMPVPRCETCRWWERDEAVEGVCGLEGKEGARYFTMPGQGAQTAQLITHMSFGCVQWEAKTGG